MLARLVAQPGPPPESWREESLALLLRGFMLLAPPMLLLQGYEWLLRGRAGWLALGLALSLAALLIWRSRALAYQWRAGAALALHLLLGALWLIDDGVLGPGPVLLIAVSALGALLMGGRAALAAWSLGPLALLAIVALGQPAAAQIVAAPDAPRPAEPLAKLQMLAVTLYAAGQLGLLGLRLAGQLGGALRRSQELSAALEQGVAARTAELAAALREREYLSAAIDTVPIGVVMSRAEAPDFEIGYANEAFSRITGYARAEVIGKNCRYLQGPETDPAAVAQLSAALRERRTQRVVLRNYRKDGSPFWNELLLSPIHDAAGGFGGFIGLQQDVSERVELAAALARQLSYAEALNECSQILLRSGGASDRRPLLERALSVLRLVLGASRIYLFQNLPLADDQLWARNVAFSAASPAPAFPLRDGFAWADFEPEVRLALAAGEAVCRPTYELSQVGTALREAQETEPPRTVLLVPIQIGGQWWGYLGTSDPVGSRSWGHSDIQFLRTATEMFAAFLSGWEARSQLLLAKLDAERAAAAKSRFLAHMSHEIRTPLNAVLGALGLLDAADLAADQRELLATAQTGGESLAQMIDNLLGLSLVESGNLTIARAPFDLVACLERAVDLVELQAGSRGLRLECRLAEDLPPAVIGDELRLRQVLVNLLTNAVKFTREGEVLLGAVPLTRHGSWVELLIEVRDSGPGIPADRVAQIFEPFTRLEVSGDPVPGTGLGLTICRQLCEAMGGTIAVESALGRGSCFSVRLSLDLAPDDRLAWYRRWPALSGRRVRLLAGRPAALAELAAILGRLGVQAIAADAPEPADLSLVDCAAGSLAPAPPEELQIWLGEGAVRQGPPGAVQLRRPLRRTRLAAAMAELLARARPAPPRPLSVLIVEDSPVGLEIASRIVERLGHSVSTASDGRQALDAVASRPYDVVLMDLQLPEMDGPTAIQHIRGLGPQVAQPWIVVLSASEIVADREGLRAIGADIVLSKPIQIGGLSAALERAAEGPPPGRPAAAPAGGPLLDPGQLHQLLESLGGDGPAVLATLLERSAAEWERIFVAAGAARAAGEPDGVARQLHLLRGMALNLGARALAARAGALERGLAGPGAPLPAAAELDGLRALADQSLAALRAHCGPPGSRGG